MTTQMVFACLCLKIILAAIWTGIGLKKLKLMLLAKTFGSGIIILVELLLLLLFMSILIDCLPLLIIGSVGLSFGSSLSYLTLKFFLQKLAHGETPTIAYLYHFNIGPNEPCPLCGLEVETTEHLF